MHDLSETGVCIELWGGKDVLEEVAFDLGLRSSRMEGDKMTRAEEGMAPARVWR